MPASLAPRGAAAHAAGDGDDLADAGTLVELELDAAGLRDQPLAALELQRLGVAAERRGPARGNPFGLDDMPALQTALPPAQSQSLRAPVCST